MAWVDKKFNNSAMGGGMSTSTAQTSGNWVLNFGSGSAEASGAFDMKTVLIVAAAAAGAWWLIKRKKA